MEWTTVENGDCLIRMDKDREIMSTLTQWAIDNGHNAGSFQAIGALKEAELGYYHLHVSDIR